MLQFLENCALKSSYLTLVMCFCLLDVNYAYGTGVDIFCRSTCEDQQTYLVSSSRSKIRHMHCYRCNGTESTSLSCTLNTTESFYQNRLNLRVSSRSLGATKFVRNFTCTRSLGNESGVYSCEVMFKAKEIIGVELPQELTTIHICISFLNSTETLLVGTLNYHAPDTMTLLSILNRGKNIEPSKDSLSNKVYKLLRFPCNKDYMLLISDSFKWICSHLEFHYRIGIGSPTLKLTPWKAIQVRNLSKLDCKSRYMDLLLTQQDLILLDSNCVHIMKPVIVKDNLGNDEVVIRTISQYDLDVHSKIIVARVLPLCSNTVVLDTRSHYSDLLIVNQFNASSHELILRGFPGEWRKVILPGWMHSFLVIDALLITNPERILLLTSWNDGKILIAAVIVLDYTTSQLVSPPFYFPDTFKPKQLMLVQDAGELLVIGNEFWLSQDFGARFTRIDFRQCPLDYNFQYYLWNLRSLDWVIDDYGYVYYPDSQCLLQYTLDSKVFNTCASNVIQGNNNGVFVGHCIYSPVTSNNISGHIFSRSDDKIIPPFRVSFITSLESLLELPSIYHNDSALLRVFLRVCDVLHGYKSRISASGDKKKVWCKQQLAGKIPASELSLAFAEASISLTYSSDSVFPVHGHFLTLNNTYTVLPVSLIGQTIALPTYGKTCWIGWILNSSMAQLDCDPLFLNAKSNLIITSNWILVDTRNSERCLQSNQSVKIINETKVVMSYTEPIHFINKGTKARIKDNLGFVTSLNATTVTLKLTKILNRNFSYDTACFLSEEKDIDRSNLFNLSKECPVTLTVVKPKQNVLFLDVLETTTFEIFLSWKKHVFSNWKRPPLKWTITNKDLIVLKIRYNVTEEGMKACILIQKNAARIGVTLIKLHVMFSPYWCTGQDIHLRVYGRCPSSKILVFKYPIEYSRDTWLSGSPTDWKEIVRITTLPVNYQPPSHRGKAIPLTRNIYNADPSKDWYRGRYKVTRDMAELKQCKGKHTRAQCGCTLSMTISSEVLYSDCISRAFRLRYREFLEPKLLISRDGKETELTFPYQLTEINNRTDYDVLNGVSTPSGEKSPYMSVKAGSKIEFKGSGLYHFRAHVVKEGYTFCDLRREFIVYIEGLPLPGSFENLVRAGTAVLFGSIVLLVFFVNV